MSNEKLRANLSFMDDIVAPRAMDARPKYSPLIPGR